jgi:acetylglutamate kinase
MTPLVLKLGGELLEDAGRLRAIASVIASTPSPLVVVHGGGREIDAALARAGIAKRQVDGLRVTDAATLAIVVEVLAGAVNTRFVAAINNAGGRAVGLTGVDGGIVCARKTAPHQAVDGQTVDLGLVGEPFGAGAPRLLVELVRGNYVPVIASIAAAEDGTLLNVNADTVAAHLAARLASPRLVIAGGTPGVLDDQGETIASMDTAAADALIGSGIASAGMIAKLRACQAALAAGAEEVVLVDGRAPSAIAAALRHTSTAVEGMTRIVTAASSRRLGATS